MKINYCKKETNILTRDEKITRELATILFIVGSLILFGIFISISYNHCINQKYKEYIKHPDAIEYMDREWGDGNTGWYHLQNSPLSVKESLINYIDSIKARQKATNND
jgi:hypothetical protein